MLARRNLGNLRNEDLGLLRSMGNVRVLSNVRSMVALYRLGEARVTNAL